MTDRQRLTDRQTKTDILRLTDPKRPKKSWGGCKIGLTQQEPS